MNQIQKNIRAWWHRIDKGILITICGIMSFSVIAMLSISPAVTSRIAAQSSFMLAKKQCLFVIVGFSTMILFSSIKWRFTIRVSIICLVILIIATAYTVIFGESIKGASRWIEIGRFSIQPSDILKPFFIVVNGVILRQLAVRKNTKLMISSVLTCIIATLLFLEPDIGMLLTYLSIWTAQLFIAGIEMMFLAIVILCVVTILSITYICFPHVRDRINSFIFLDNIPYQTKKSLVSIENGGWFGRGIGVGETKYDLPDAHSDYIFAAIWEEWGGIICLLLLACYLFIILRPIILLITIKNTEAKIIGSGIVMMFFIHVAVSIGVNINILPAKGTTLPFLSYGGSSILSSCIGAGILINLISKNISHINIFELIKLKLIKE